MMTQHMCFDKPEKMSDIQYLTKRRVNLSVNQFTRKFAYRQLSMIQLKYVQLKINMNLLG